ncbi:MAG: hypothetical protein VXY11_03820 [Candidatus Thermoplasmatota archaeon]|nr:hypothetical protein [Candidatus Thermoplasmatota archaeon]
MDGNSYYQNLLQQGFTPTDAAHYTKQYYPDFQAPMQGMGMMAPPPGAMEFGGAASTGFGTAGAVGSMAGGGITAAGAGAAATGGGMSFATISVVSVLVLGGAGTAGYFIYDYLTEPDFYGEVYWTEYGSGFSFEEDKLSIVFAVEKDACSSYEDMYGEGSDAEFRNGLCFVSPDYDSYEVTDEGDYYKICVSAEDIDDDDSECIKVYPLDRGIVMKNEYSCDVMVSDISTPDFNMETEDSYDEFLDWQETWRNIASELEEEGPSSCDYSIGGGDENSNSGNLQMYDFSGRLTQQTLSNASGESMMYVQMNQGDRLSWALLEIKISIDGGPSEYCDHGNQADSNSVCVMEVLESDSTWDVGEEVLIKEGENYDLCDGSNGECSTTVTIIKIGVGNEDDMVLAEFTLDLN